MARKAQNGEVNKSQAIRDLLATNPKIKATEAIAELKAKGIAIKQGLFYLVKGKTLGSRKRRRREGTVTNAIPSPAKAKGQDAIAVIGKVKLVASEVGGLKTLAAIVDALTQ